MSKIFAEHYSLFDILFDNEDYYYACFKSPYILFTCFFFYLIDIHASSYIPTYYM